MNTLISFCHTLIDLCLTDRQCSPKLITFNVILDEFYYVTVKYPSEYDRDYMPIGKKLKGFCRRNKKSSNILRIMKF